jgi:hypothetical protein
MYLREKRIRFLNVKNVVFVILGVFLSAFCVETMTELTVHYFGDWETILYARRTPESAVTFLVGVLLIVYSRVSRRMIQDARYFSRYFEGDLSGYIEFGELAEVTGRKVPQVRRRLKLLRRLYMKKFECTRTETGREIVELYSKTVTCTCRSCGGAMEKRVYFTGECPYCGSSDLTARVVSGESFYFISDDKNRRVNDPSYYEGRGLNGKKLWLVIGLSAAAIFVAIFTMMLIDQLVHYNDPEYLKQELFADNHRSTYELIHKHMREMIILASFSIVAIGAAIPVLLSRLVLVEKARRFARFFSRVSTPYVAVSALSKTGSGDPDRELRGVVKAIREGCLRGCSPEKHGGPLRIGLAKQIVKDRCPSCAAPITGAVDEGYTCKYCGNLIMGVIRKQ